LKAQRRTCSRNFENRQGQIRDRSRNTLQVLRLINGSDAIDLLDEIGGIVERTSLSHRERLLLIRDRLTQRFSTPFSPRRKSAKKQKKPQSEAAS
jgi:hypothetical protein